MRLLYVAGVVLTGWTGAGPATWHPESRIVADSVSLLALTSEQVTGYIAVETAVRQFWTTPEGKRLAETPKRPWTVGVRTPHSTSILTVYLDDDYPALVQRNTVLADIFKTAHFTSEQYAPIYMTIAAAAQWVKEGTQTDSATVMGQNVALLKAHWSELERLEQPGPALTVDQMAAYIATEKALEAFWDAPEHDALKKEAEATKAVGFSITINLNSEKAMEVADTIYNYPQLIVGDTTLAAIFSKNQLSVQEYMTARTKIAQTMTLLYAPRTIKPVTGLTKDPAVEQQQSRLEELKFIAQIHKMVQRP